MRSIIICVDDERVLLGILYGQLEEWFGKNYRIEKFQDPAEALNKLQDFVNKGMDVSVFISDYIMPVMKGDALLAEVKKISPDTKRIMMTGYAAAEGMINAINKAGIYRYVLKPWDSKDLILTLLEAIKSFEQNKKAEELKIKYESLYHKYENLYNEKEGHYKSLLSLISQVCDIKDPSSVEHSTSVANLCDIIGREMRISSNQIKNLTEAAYLHNIGKLSLSDSDIHKIKTMDRYSEELLTIRVIQASNAENILEVSDDFRNIIPIVKYQFEYFSGGGPFGLKGNNIPIEARILHVANLYVVYNTLFKTLLQSEIKRKIEKTMYKYTDPSVVISLFNYIDKSKNL